MWREGNVFWATERDYGNLDEVRLALYGYERREGATGEYKSRDTPRLAFFLAQLKTGTSARPLSSRLSNEKSWRKRKWKEVAPPGEKSHVAIPFLPLLISSYSFLQLFPILPNFVTPLMSLLCVNFLAHLKIAKRKNCKISRKIRGE